MDVLQVISLSAQLATVGPIIAADVEYGIKSTFNYTNHGAPVTEMSLNAHSEGFASTSYSKDIQTVRVEHWEFEK